MTRAVAKLVDIDGILMVIVHLAKGRRSNRVKQGYTALLAFSAEYFTRHDIRFQVVNDNIIDDPNLIFAIILIV